jgi:D-sedoheptulose 7-phosphate isomerase
MKEIIMEQLIKHSLQEAQEALSQFVCDERNIRNICEAIHLMATAIYAGNKIVSCGNGGSLCDASHFAEELTGRYRKNRQPYPAIAMNDVAYITCAANDFGYDRIFSRYIDAVCTQGDVLLAVSTSGNSLNVLNAVEKAHEKGVKVIALTSESDNLLAKQADITIAAPKTAYSDRIQEIHIKVIHIFVEGIESVLQNK